MGGLAVTINAPISFTSAPVPGTPLEVALLFGTSLRLGGGAAPVHLMGGGPRTYPGGVTKWQWKRMQLKKSSKIEKARLLREKHIYEARRRAELLAASPVLEMPWQKMSRVRPSNYITADEQVTKLAARFQKQGAEDLWTEKDGPEKFVVLNDESSPLLSTARSRNQGRSQLNPHIGEHSNEHWNREEDGGPTWHRPPLRPSSPSRSEASYRGISRPPHTRSDGQSNRVQDARPSPYSQYVPRIRLGPPHPEPFFNETSRRPHN